MITLLGIYQGVLKCKRHSSCWGCPLDEARGCQRQLIGLGFEDNPIIFLIKFSPYLLLAKKDKAI